MSDEPHVIGGVSLEQHAGVTAALAEDLALEDVLAQEQIEPERWSEADRAWKRALAESSDLLLLYMQRRRQAEDCLARKIEPLDEDAAAWAGMLAEIASADDAGAVLAPFGLRMSDIGRLGRHWKRKAAKDPKVVEALSECAGNAVVPESVQCAPMELKPFPWTPKSEEAASISPDETSAVGDVTGEALLRSVRGGRLPIEFDLDLYAAMLAVRQSLPEQGAPAFALCGVDATRMLEIADAWAERVAASPTLRAELTVRTADHAAALRSLLAGVTPVRG